MIHYLSGLLLHIVVFSITIQLAFIALQLRKIRQNLSFVTSQNSHLYDTLIEVTAIASRDADDVKGK